MFAYQGVIPDIKEGLAKIPQGIYEESSTAKGRLGTKRRVGDQIYRYAKAGGTALAIGKPTVHPTPAGNHQNVVIASAVAVDDSSITVTLGDTAATLNQYQDGFLTVSDGTGQGTTYHIKSNPAADASASLKLTLHDKVHTALATSVECCLTPNLWNGLVISTSQAQQPAGVPIIGVTASYYYWSLTGGIGSALADENVTLGLRVTIGSSTDGSVEGLDGAGEPEIGKTIMALVDTEYRPIHFTIDK